MNAAAEQPIDLELTVNGASAQARIEPRTSLCDLLRDTLHLTGTHAGCEHGTCGACTVLLDGQPARACITLAVACEGRSVTTIEGLSGPLVDRLRAAFHAEHALQCGFCTPGCLSFGPIGQKFTTSVTEACARRPGAAASVSRRRRERRILLAGGGRRASRSHTLAASQAFERMHMLFCHRVKT
jgi:hypothetical protein